MSIWPDLLKIVCGGVFGWLLAYGSQLRKSKKDEIKEYCVDLCGYITASADLASSYWIDDEIDNIRSVESRIIGYQAKIAKFLDILRRFISYEDYVTIEYQIALLMDSLSGGSFGSKERNLDRTRARLCQEISAELIYLIKVAWIETTSDRKALSNFFRRKWRLLLDFRQSARAYAHWFRSYRDGHH